VGRNSGTVTASFWDVQTSLQTTSAGGTGKTTAEMQDPITFLDAGWDFVGEWENGPSDEWAELPGGGYPILWWQLSPFPPLPTFSGGTGEPEDPYLISTANDLNRIGHNQRLMTAHFKITNDISLTGVNFFTIGSHPIPFTGVFDGSDRAISNFTYDSNDRNYIGLFGRVRGEIKNLGLIYPNVNAGTGRYVGALVGQLSGGTITNCYVQGGTVSGRLDVGGLVGWKGGTVTNCYAIGSVLGSSNRVGGLVGWNGGTVTNCYSAGSVSGTTQVGGLVGRNNQGTITNCYSTGSVSGLGNNAGGLVGNNNSGTITNCYATGSVLGSGNNVGGLVGNNRYGTITNCCSTGSTTVLGNNAGGLVGNNPNGTITNCYATGSVSGVSNVGGLAGYNRGTITNCYSAGSVSGTTDVGGLVGYDSSGSYTKSFWDNTVNSGLQSIGSTSDPNVIGESTANMQTQSTFTDVGWDFVGESFNGIDDIWFIPKQDYPHLWWEGMQVPMKLTPRTLNCRSEGNWVKAHLTLPEGFTIADVDSDRPSVLHPFGFESASLYVFVNKDKLVQIDAAFEREAVCSLTGDWPQILTVAGFLADGNIFLGTSNVRIIHPGLKVIEDLASCWLQGDCVHPTWCDGIDMNRDSLVNLLDYALLMNINVEFVNDE
jgi:hypothetical protein